MPNESALLDPYRAPADDFSPVTGLPGRYSGYARVTARAAALVIDYLVLLATGYLLSMAILRVGERSRVGPESLAALFAAAWLLMAALYSSAFESSQAQGTLGKMALGLQVVDRHGRPISFARALVRFFGKLLSLFILGIGFLIAPFSDRKLALHDVLAGTRVAKVK